MAPTRKTPKSPDTTQASPERSAHTEQGEDQLQNLLQAMTQERQADREQITALLSQIAALTAANQTIPSIERDTPSSDSPASSRSSSTKDSKKRPDPPVFTNGIDPVFESWKIQMQAKLRANADHYPTEED